MSVETRCNDSTEANVIEAALEHIPGRGIVNSINMENGRKRIDSACPREKKHGLQSSRSLLTKSEWPRPATGARSRQGPLFYSR